MLSLSGLKESNNKSDVKNLDYQLFGFDSEEKKFTLEHFKLEAFL